MPPDAFIAARDSGRPIEISDAISHDDWMMAQAAKKRAEATSEPPQLPDVAPMEAESPPLPEVAAMEPDAAPMDAEAPAAEDAAPRNVPDVEPKAACVDTVAVVARDYSDLPQGQRELAQDLDKLRQRGDWTPVMDLELATSIGRGHKIHVAAADLGVDTEAASKRYSSLTRSIRDRTNRVTIDGQKHLLAELRRRVDMLKGKIA